MTVRMLRAHTISGRQKLPDPETHSGKKESQS